MSHARSAEVEFWAQLAAWDLEAARQVQRRGCPHCGGRLDRADFPRKARGLPEEADPYFATRVGLCCAREGCRRRCLPPSVRFLGRHVYAAVAIVEALLVSAVSQCWQVRRRLRRWSGWWRSTWWPSAAGQAAAGWVAGGLDPDALPRSLHEALGGLAGRARVLRTLELASGFGPLRMQGE